jgi:hypothetical protein
MGIQVEFNPDLALRNISEFKNGNRKEEECIPENIIAGEIYSFLKEGQRNYWFLGEVPLVETKGNQNLSRPKASVLILEAVHFTDNGKVYTRGKYKVVNFFNDDKIHFDGFNKLE